MVENKEKRLEVNGYFSCPSFSPLTRAFCGRGSFTRQCLIRVVSGWCPVYVEVLIDGPYS